MKYSCLHTHTSWCDGEGSVEDFCVMAHQLGFSVLGFSAHAPLPKTLNVSSDWHLREENLSSYLAEVNDAKKRWKNKLKIYCGLEIDYIRGYSGPADSYYQSIELDYRIGSVHCVLPNGKDPLWALPHSGNKLLCIDGTREDLDIILQKGFSGNARLLVEEYYNSVIEMCSAGGFDILGHADLIVKNNFLKKFFSEHDDYYARCIESLAECVSKKNICVEINTGGLIRKKINRTYPSVQMLNKFSCYDVPVTINADAHSPDHLGGCYDAAITAAASAGYTKHQIFAGRLNGAAQWESEAI